MTTTTRSDLSPTRLAVALCCAGLTCSGLAACTGNQASTATHAAAADGPPQASSAAPGSDPPGAGRGSACSLVTEQEAATALGKDPGPATQSIPQRCVYGQRSSVMVTLVPVGGKAAFDHARAKLESDASSHVADIAGVGDLAFGTFGGPLASIEFVKGDALVNITLRISGATTPPKDQVTVLATTAAGRI